MKTSNKLLTGADVIDRAVGTIDDSAERCDLDLSRILSFLIKKVGTLTEDNQADLFKLWMDVDILLEYLLDEYSKSGTWRFVFGIRKHGVDSNVATRIRLKATDANDEDPYMAIYILDISFDKETHNVVATLYDAVFREEM